eukprot:scaffold99238_cov67-Phaeocystis_antarctica.AAC.2
MNSSLSTPPEPSASAARNAPLIEIAVAVLVIVVELRVERAALSGQHQPRPGCHGVCVRACHRSRARARARACACASRRLPGP